MIHRLKRRVAMKRAVQYAFFVALLALVSGIVSPRAWAETRTWSDASGKYRIEAELVYAGDGNVRLKKTDGRVVTVPLSKLSDADRRFVRDWLAEKRKGPGDLSKLPVLADAIADVELVNGSRIQGKITAVSETHVSVKVTIGSRTYLRKYPTDRIHAVTVGDRRVGFNEREGGAPATGTGNSPGSGDARKTQREIEALIEKLGRTPPDWWESVSLNYPNTLDLTWPRKPPGGWNARRNVGQYFWDIVNPNPGKWKEGLRLAHHLLLMHQKDPEKRTRAMDTLAGMYYRFFQDYARAAFWWEKTGLGKERTTPAIVRLAECYWRLGNKQMALDLLNRRTIYLSSIKLLADMGETHRALQLAEAAARSSAPELALLYAGDACRIQGQYEKALKYYQRVLALPATGKAKERIQKCQNRARANIEGIRIFDALDLSRIPDGTYRGSSHGYAGMLQVEVVVRSGRIESVRVTSHKEKQFYSSLTDTPKEIIEKQGVKGVAAVTGATITSEAIVNATAKALAGAK